MNSNPETGDRSSKHIVCVTGAAGYIASQIIQQLLEAGHKVRGTVRDLSDDWKRAHLDRLASEFPGQLELFEANLLTEGSFETALESCDVLLHTAAAVTFAAKDPQRQIVDVAVKGTENVLKSALKSPTLKHIVMTSSIAAVMSYGRENGSTFNENDWCDSSDVFCDPYGMAKTQSEKKLWELTEGRDDISVTTINPGFVVGPPMAKHHVRTSLGPLRELVNRKVPACPPIFFHLVDVRDVAQAHLRAFERPEADRKRIICTNKGYWMRDISMTFASRFKTPTRRLPGFFVYIQAIFDSRIELRFVKLFLNYAYDFNSTRLKDILGIEHRDIDASLLETAEIMVEQGWCPRAKRIS